MKWVSYGQTKASIYYFPFELTTWRQRNLCCSIIRERYDISSITFLDGNFLFRKFQTEVSGPLSFKRMHFLAEYNFLITHRQWRKLLYFFPFILLSFFSCLFMKQIIQALLYMYTYQRKLQFPLFCFLT